MLSANCGCSDRVIFHEHSYITHAAVLLPNVKVKNSLGALGNALPLALPQSSEFSACSSKDCLFSIPYISKSQTESLDVA